MSISKPRVRRPKRPAARGPLSAERVAEAGVAMADEAGLAALSMRGLAERLGVEAMSLYHHLPNKDCLIDAMVDRVAGEIALPEPGRSWRAQMRRRALSALEALTRHAWAALPFLSRLNTGPHMLAYMDRTHGCLRAAGFSPRGADWARHLMDSHIYGYFLQEIHFPIRPEEYASSAASFLPMIPASRFPYLREIAEAVIAGDYDGRNSFEFGLEIILDGLERQLKANADVRTRKTPRDTDGL